MWESIRKEDHCPKCNNKMYKIPKSEMGYKGIIWLSYWKCSCGYFKKIEVKK